MSTQNDHSIDVGQQLGPYRIEALIGMGGMGLVYRAHDRALSRTVAIKVVDRRRADADTTRWLVHEARIAAALNHPSICSVHEVGFLGDQPFIVMEHVKGAPLGALIPHSVGFPSETALHYTMQIADAVAHAHRRGIVHRDLKTSNIMIAADGRATLLDFGLAIRASDAEPSGIDTTGVPEIPVGAGTVPYMAPELLRGRQADKRTDVWALGVLMYEMVSGRRPFRGATSWELAAAILVGPAAPLPRTVPPGWRTVIARSLMHNASDRYPCAGALSAALDDLQ
jgi:serine/threonine protein kinase